MFWVGGVGTPAGALRAPLQSGRSQGAPTERARQGAIRGRAAVKLPAQERLAALNVPAQGAGWG